MSDRFIGPAQKYFRYLIEDYEFVVKDVQQPDERRLPRILYESDEVGLVVTVDKGGVVVWVGPTNSPADWSEIVLLIPYLYREGIGEPIYIFPETPDHIERQIEWVAGIVRRYLDPVLRGEFHEWAEVNRYWEKRGRAYHKELMRRRAAGEPLFPENDPWKPPE